MRKGRYKFQVTGFKNKPSCNVKPETCNSQSGNVFFIILIAVALFAGLSYTVSKGMSTGGDGQLSERQAELAATEILDYAQKMSRAVDRLRRKGCSENELSFEYDEDNDGVYNDSDESYYNANAPSNFSCHIFHSAGANLKRIPLSNKYKQKGHIEDWNITVIQNKEDNNNPVDLALFASYISLGICRKINTGLKINNIPRDAGSFGSAAFNGNYNLLNSIKNSSGFSNINTVCFEGHINPPTGTYHFYSIILSR